MKDTLADADQATAMDYTNYWPPAGGPAQEVVLMRLPHGVATLDAVATPLHEAVVIEFPRRKIEPAVVMKRATAATAGPRAIIVDGYLCSSTQSYWCTTPASIDRRHIERLAAGRGWRIGRIFEQSTPERPTTARTLLDQALERVESRESDGLVVARLKHLGQPLGKAAAALERISAAGGKFVSVCDGVDLDTAAGRLVLRVLLGELRQ
ncbi:MAG: recombinase family protein [Solirubrobacteraceae bacterium]